MYFSQGIDIVETNRIKKVVSLYGKKFLNKILSEKELLNFNYSNPKKEMKNYLAYLLKEAVSKALGLGFRNGVTYRNIEIINNEFNKPEINLVGDPKKY